jgi:hypothetical protein
VSNKKKKRGCGKKIRYESIEDARLALWGFKNKWLKARCSFTIYQCQWCGGFHLGHTVKKLIKAGDIIIHL